MSNFYLFPVYLKSKKKKEKERKEGKEIKFAIKILKQQNKN